MKACDLSGAFALVLVLVAAACSSTTEAANPSKGETDQKYVFVSECNKWNECDAAGFAAAHPGGVEGCPDDDFATLTKIVGSDILAQAGPCTRAQLEQCTNSYAAAACPPDAEIKAGDYLPHSPDSSCVSCGWHL